MTKQGFLSELRARLAGLPREDMEERINFYSEMIDDRIEEGDTEEAAVSEIGSIDEVVSQILSDYPLAKIVKENVKPKRRLRAWEIVLLILGSPIWLSLLIAAFAVVLSVYMAVWSVVISLWAVAASLAVCGVFGTVMAFIYAFQGNIPLGMAALGTGLFGAGAAILMIFGCIAASKGMSVLTKKIIIGIKTLFVGRERN